jgi:polyisoprenoid-binding protein YceI
MPSTQTPDVSVSSLTDGTWDVDASASEVKFTARGMFGLVPVHGSFGAFDGTLEIEGTEASGQLQIEAATLDTKNAKRDTHLRSRDFFEVDNYPTVTFQLTGLATAADGTLTFTGLLKIRQTELPVEGPVVATTLPDGRLKLETTVAVDRDAAGLSWSKLGVIKGKAQLHTSVVLTHAA